ncbi:hypothetical protein V8C26DRAFT_392319 [Trichoderma gracile]
MMASAALLPRHASACFFLFSCLLSPLFSGCLFCFLDTYRSYLALPHEKLPLTASQFLLVLAGTSNSLLVPHSPLMSPLSLMSSPLQLPRRQRKRKKCIAGQWRGLQYFVHPYTAAAVHR